MPFLKFYCMDYCPYKTDRAKIFYVFPDINFRRCNNNNLQVYFSFRTNVFYIISDLLCLISIQGRKSSKLLIMLISVLSITTFIVEFWGLGYKGEFLLITFCNFLLFYKFFQQSIIKYTEEKILSIFLGCLSLYELISVTKLVGFITDAASATLYFEIVLPMRVLTLFRIHIV